VGAAGEDRDRAAVDRAGSQRAANRELDLVGALVAAEQHDVDHLAGSVRAPVASGQRGPELVEAGGPSAAAAFLGQRERTLEPTGLARQQLEVVVELCAGAELAVQPLMARDLPAPWLTVISVAPTRALTFNPATATGTE
jgi:hypothetical protein